VIDPVIGEGLVTMEKMHVHLYRHKG
jgi:hypothetical protein